MPTIESIFEQAMQLDEGDRETLWRLIANSVDAAHVEVDEDLLDELDRRCAEFDRGEVKGIDPFESIERLQRILREERGA